MGDLIDTIVYAGRLKDKVALLNSSSGGAFTALSDHFLENGNAVVAAMYNYKNHVTEFKLILNKEQCNQAKGSKYMQAKSGNIYREAYDWLSQNKEKYLLFVGMGCQAEGFRKFSEMRGIRNRVCIVDIVCHGVPSPKLWREYAAILEKRYKGKITYLTFKDKRNGWMKPTAYVMINEKEYMIQDYVNIFYNRCVLRPSCHKCPYATTTRNVDITIGDFWHIEKEIPEFYKSEGNSLFMIHTIQGYELFEKIKNVLEYKRSNTTQCWQENLEFPTKKSEHRDEFWDNYRSKGFDFVLKRYGTISIKGKLKNKFNKIILKIRSLIKN